MAHGHVCLGPYSPIRGPARVLSGSVCTNPSPSSGCSSSWRRSDAARPTQPFVPFCSLVFIIYLQSFMCLQAASPSQRQDVCQTPKPDPETVSSAVRTDSSWSTPPVSSAGQQQSPTWTEYQLQGGQRCTGASLTALPPA